MSLLPICRKVFKKIIFNSLFVHLNNNNLLHSNQSGFRAGDSCVHQLISVTHDIYKAFDANPSLEVKGVFLDLSKAFDKVWHGGLLYKLRRMGVCGKYFGLIDSFLSDRPQRVLLNVQTSKWSQIKAGVRQGSVLGPLLFLVFINDLPEGLTSNVKLFADNTSIFSVVHDVSSLSLSLNEDLSKIWQWGCKWKMLFNPNASKQSQKTFFSWKKNPSNHSNMYFNNMPLKRKNTQKYLGLRLDAKLNFSEHINEKRK